MFDENNIHLGSVEISFSSISFSEIFHKQFQTVTTFLILKKVADKKLFNDEKKNYVNSFLKDFYIEKKAFDYLSTHINNFEKDYMIVENKKSLELNKKALEGINISLNMNSKELIMLPIKNPVTKKLEALFLIQHNHGYIYNKYKNYYFITFFMNLFFIIIAYLLYRNDVKKTKLQYTNKKLETIIKEVDSGIAIMDLEGNFLDVNNAYSEILGYSKKELLALNCIELTTKDQEENAMFLLKHAELQGSISKYHKTCIKKDKTLINLEFSLTLLPSKDSFIAVINSMEEKIQLEKLNHDLHDEVEEKIQELRQKDKMLFQQSKTAAMGEMIDAIAHQWKGPLGIIKLYVNQIEYNLENDQEIFKEDLIEYSQNMDRQIDHLVNTIDEFRSFFRTKNTLESIPIQVVLDSVQKLMKDELIKNTIQIEVKGDTTRVVKLISNEFKHVLINLISNSRDAFVEKDIQNRIITLEIEASGDDTILKVKDNAGGIPEKIIGKIFEPNFTTKESGKGTGIGLYMSKQILDKANATVQVYNENNGVCFEINLHN